MQSNTFVLYSRPYLDTFQKCYKNIVTINVIPRGPLGKYVRKVQFPPLSEFKDYGPCGYNRDLCGLALQSLNELNGCCGGYLMVVDEVPDLFSFLMSHNYKIDTSLTKMMNASDVRFHTSNANKIICFVTYEGK